MENVKVSVIIPIYNAEKYLSQCLESVLEQTLEEIEVICINDCSTDGSLDIIYAYAQKDERILIVQNDCNQGAGPSRNIGIRKATGDYFVLFDADDFFDKDLLKRAYEYAKENKLQLTFYKHIIYDTITGKIYESNPLPEWFERNYRNRFFSWNDVQRFAYQTIFCVPWNRMYEREFVIKSGVKFPNLSNSEDLYFGNLILAKASRMGVLTTDSPMIYYRINVDDQISMHVGEAPLCMLESLVMLQKGLMEMGIYNECRKSFHSCAVNLLLFPIGRSDKKEEALMYIAKSGFGLLHMQNLCEKDFVNKAFYEVYKELSNANQYYVNLGFEFLWEQESNKVANFLSYLREHEYNIAIWGMGIKGKLVVDRLKREKCKITALIDQNQDKQGTTYQGYDITSVDNVKKRIDIIIVTNQALSREIYQAVKSYNPKIKLLNIHAYLIYDIAMEDCIY